jgi:hypothetical protein
VQDVADDGDRVRLLHRNPALGYTHVASLAAKAEPEAVPADYQREISDRARLNEARRLRRGWQATSLALHATLDGYVGRADPRLRREVKALRAALARADRRAPRLP